ncbi:Alpha/Beta hydrolase protein [Hypoxylon cercidicola]|nr:Alpha/Beta hydrolase protein [Hypoxylon cercidicola]
MYDFSHYGVPSKEWLELSNRLPAPPPNLSFDQSRDYANKEREKSSAELMEIWASKVQTSDHTIPTRDNSSLQSRSYRPTDCDDTQKLPVILYFHGGGFFSGTVATEDAVCSRIAVNTRTVVLNVCYRHTPEFVYPTPWNDAEDAFEWLHNHINDLGGDSQRVIVGGMSSGAYLTASLVLGKHLGRTSVTFPSIAGQILMVPPLINVDCYEPMIKKFQDPAVCSLNQNKDEPMLSMSNLQLYTGLLKIQNPDEHDLKLNPGYVSTSQATGLPPTVCAVAGLDVLRDEGLLFASTLVKAGVPTDVHVFPGLPHSFAMFPALPETERWNKAMDEGISWILSKPTASGVLDLKTKPESR